jgi:hypothetical protein
MPPSQLPVRASDAERDEAVVVLRERFAAGQLSQETFTYRMEAALGARDQRELAELFTDLPRRGAACPVGAAGRPAGWAVLAHG